MDELFAAGALGILIICAGAAVILCGIVHLLRLELSAFAAGDTGFILASLAVLLLLIAAYIGTGLWLRRTGRI